MWLTNNQCQKVVDKAWHSPCIGSIAFKLVTKLNSSRYALTRWYKACFDFLQKWIDDLENELAKAQQNSNWDNTVDRQIQHELRVPNALSRN